MLLYVAITHPVDGEVEEKVETCVEDWYQNQRMRWEMAGVLPYDPVLREIAIDVGNIPINQAGESLRVWLSQKTELDESDYALSDHSSIEDLSHSERVEHFRHKLLYLLGSIRRLNHTLESERIRQIEYLLGGIATEAADLLPTQQSVITEPPLEEGLSRKLDEFWKSL